MAGTNHRGRRPPLLSPARFGALLLAIRDGATFTNAAQAAGVSPKTAGRWIDADPELAALIADARAEAAEDDA